MCSVGTVWSITNRSLLLCPAVRQSTSLTSLTSFVNEYEYSLKAERDLVRLLVQCTQRAAALNAPEGVRRSQNAMGSEVYNDVQLVGLHLCWDTRLSTCIYSYQRRIKIKSKCPV